MQISYRHTLRNACKSYGPGGLPKADQPDIGAGYAAAAAAFVATGVYAGSMIIGDAVGMSIDGTVFALFAILALPFVVPAAFLVGVGGWRVVPTETSFAGVIAGGIGAIATYLVALVPVGVLVTAAAAASITGAEPAVAAVSTIGLVFYAFVLTWWVTIPIGCIGGFVYMNAIESGE